jgi:uncharacterized protein (DUF1501 family)
MDALSRKIARRALLRATAGSFAGMLLARLLAADDAFAAAPSGAKRQKSIVLLWMNGGPSHLDTWDPKPGTPRAGPMKAIKTAAPDLSISEHMPLLAQQAQKLCVVRSGMSKEGNHQRAQYLMHTGYAPNPTVQHPSIGGWASMLLGDASNGLPAFVSIGGPSAGAGFLGVQNGPFIVQKAGDLPQNVSSEADATRFESRRQILERMESRFAGETGDAKVDGRRALYAKAIRMMQSPRVKAFDLSDEPESVKKDYGATDFGRGCLAARRLVEAGARFVEVTLDGWDTHKDNFTRTKKLMDTLDPAMSALLKDLEARKLLDSTLVVWMGDFGRTPKINANDGRDHHPGSWSAVLAGGGARGGLVYGATDAAGDKVVSKPASVPNLLATIVQLLGIDPGETRTSPAGRPIGVTDDGAAIKELIA